MESADIHQIANKSALSERLSTFEICQEPEIAWGLAFGRLLLATLVIVALPVMVRVRIAAVIKFEGGRISIRGDCHLASRNSLTTVLLDRFYGSIIYDFDIDGIET